MPNARRRNHMNSKGFGAMGVSKPHKFIWFGDVYGSNLINSWGFGDDSFTHDIIQRGAVKRKRKDTSV